MNLPEQYLSVIIHFIRTKKGKFVGIHSPFLYNLSTELTGKLWPFYSFNNLNNNYEPNKKDKYFFEILFRLTNYLRPDEIFYLGNGNTLALLYCSKACKNAIKHLISDIESIKYYAKKIFSDEQVCSFDVLNAGITDYYRNIRVENNKNELIIIDIDEKSEILTNDFRFFLDNAHSGTVFVIKNIYSKKQMKDFWVECQKNKEVSAVMKFSGFGLIFFRKDLEKREYYL